MFTDIPAASSYDDASMGLKVACGLMCRDGCRAVADKLYKCGVTATLIRHLQFEACTCPPVRGCSLHCNYGADGRCLANDSS